jgi:hypothetical protein
MVGAISLRWKSQVLSAKIGLWKLLSPNWHSGRRVANTKFCVNPYAHSLLALPAVWDRILALIHLTPMVFTLPGRVERQIFYPGNLIPSWAFLEIFIRNSGMQSH